MPDKNTHKATILVVDDDADSRGAIAHILKRDDFRVLESSDGSEALKILDTETVDTVVADLHMPGIGGMEVLRSAMADIPPVPVVIITGFGTVEHAVEAMKLGAVDFVTKPPDVQALQTNVRRAVERRMMLSGAKRRGANDGFGSLLGTSRPMQSVFDQIRRCAPFKSTVLITGESGTGKELVAQAIHGLSTCRKGPFIAVNCSSLPDDLVESHLFGHEKGAFTGATSMQKGYFEAAEGGTLFLDEIGDLALDAQANLLRTLEERQVMRVGSTKPIPVNVRLLAATNVNLKTASMENRFRSDLYYRLDVLQIALPPLRDRKEDIPLLVQVFLDNFAREHGLPPKEIAEETMTYLQSFDWPGNVRELKNMAERLAILSAGSIIQPTDLPERFYVDIELKQPTGTLAHNGVTLEEIERSVIEQTLVKTNGNRTHTAEILDISVRTLQRKLKVYNLT